MLCKALKSFVSVVNMKKGDTRELTPEFAKALIKSGFVVACEDNNEAQSVEVAEPETSDAEEPETPEAGEDVVEAVKSVETSKPATAKRGRPSKK